MLDFRKRYVDYNGGKIYEMKDGTFMITCDGVTHSGLKSLNEARNVINRIKSN